MRGKTGWVTGAPPGHAWPMLRGIILLLHMAVPQGTKPHVYWRGSVAPRWLASGMLMLIAREVKDY